MHSSSYSCLKSTLSSLVYIHVSSLVGLCLGFVSFCILVDIGSKYHFDHVFNIYGFLHCIPECNFFDSCALRHYTNNCWCPYATNSLRVQTHLVFVGFVDVFCLFVFVFFFMCNAIRLWWYQLRYLMTSYINANVVGKYIVTVDIFPQNGSSL